MNAGRAAARAVVVRKRADMIVSVVFGGSCMEIGVVSYGVLAVAMAGLYYFRISS